MKINKDREGRVVEAREGRRMMLQSEALLFSDQKKPKTKENKKSTMGAERLLYGGCC